MTIPAFQKTVLAHYRAHGRHDLPWRQAGADNNFDPYKILVSELMLQQTQVGRVIPKFRAFIAAYPTFESLAATPLADVLALWSGLGYNRRAQFLWQSARVVAEKHGGKLPQTQEELFTLPGVGPGTAGAILVYAFNRREVFIETNVRTVFIHHFFSEEQKVSDVSLKPLVRATIPDEKPREWYWALMDYGTYLKQTVGNLSRVSASYTKQSAFHGSRRQLRGAVLWHLIAGPLTIAQLQAHLPDERLKGVLLDLRQEGLIRQNGVRYLLGA